jgi:hypothetical protein
MMTTSYHEPDKIQVNTFYSIPERRFYTMPPLNRQNPYQAKRLTRRCLLQLGEENVDTYGFVHWEYVDGYKQALNRDGVMCRILRQNDGPAVILSKMGNHALPNDQAEREKLVMGWIMNIPNGKKIGGNDNFGGKHAGFYFPPKNPGQNIRIHAELWDVEVTLDSDEIKHKTGDGSDIVIVSMSGERAEKYVRDTFD